MNIQMIGDNIEIDERFKQIVAETFEDNIDRLLIDFQEDMKHATMKVSKIKDKDEFIVNFDMWLPGKEHVYADSMDKTFKTAIVKLRESVESQIRKYKEEIRNY